MQLLPKEIEMECRRLLIFAVSDGLLHYKLNLGKRVRNLYVARALKMFGHPCIKFFL
jgi:hypothetical protein